MASSDLEKTPEIEQGRWEGLWNDDSGYCYELSIDTTDLKTWKKLDDNTLVRAFRAIFSESRKFKQVKFLLFIFCFTFIMTCFQAHNRLLFLRLGMAVNS